MTINYSQMPSSLAWVYMICSISMLTALVHSSKMAKVGLW